MSARSTELAGPIPPAALLDATHRDRRLTLSGDQHGSVEHPVLLCSPKFLTLDEKHSFLSLISNKESGDGAGFTHFFNSHRPGVDRFIREQVFHTPVRIRKQRKNSQGLIADRVANANLWQ